jgi:hypothetical protein
MAKDLSSRSDYHNTNSIKRPDTPLAETPIGKKEKEKEMTAKEYLASGKPTGGDKPSVKKEMNAKEYLASGKPTKYVKAVAPEGYTKVMTGPGVYEMKRTDKAKEYLAKK